MNAFAEEDHLGRNMFIVVPTEVNKDHMGNIRPGGRTQPFDHLNLALEVLKEKQNDSPKIEKASIIL